MCLRVGGLGLHPKKRKRDIKCYKVVEQRTYSNGLVEFFTPCARAGVNIEIIKGNGDYVAKSSFFNTMSPIKMDVVGERYYIAGGFIHVFKHLKSAEKFVEMGKKNYYNLQIYECVIPSGTTYYKGLDESTENRAYAADRIKFVKRVS